MDIYIHIIFIYYLMDIFQAKPCLPNRGRTFKFQLYGFSVLITSVHSFYRISALIYWGESSVKGIILLLQLRPPST